MVILKIDTEKCKGCGLCVRACPKKILKISETFINKQGYHPAELTQPEACIGCSSCALTCPDVCIDIRS